MLRATRSIIFTCMLLTVEALLSMKADYSQGIDALEWTSSGPENPQSPSIVENIQDYIDSENAFDAQLHHRRSVFSREGDNESPIRVKSGKRNYRWRKTSKCNAERKRGQRNRLLHELKSCRCNNLKYSKPKIPHSEFETGRRDFPTVAPKRNSSKFDPANWNRPLEDANFKNDKRLALRPNDVVSNPQSKLGSENFPINLERMMNDANKKSPVSVGNLENAPNLKDALRILPALLNARTISHVGTLGENYNYPSDARNNGPVFNRENLPSESQHCDCNDLLDSSILSENLANGRTDFDYNLPLEYQDAPKNRQFVEEIMVSTGASNVYNDLGYESLYAKLAELAQNKVIPAQISPPASLNYHENAANDASYDYDELENYANGGDLYELSPSNDDRSDFDADDAFGDPSAENALPNAARNLEQKQLKTLGTADLVDILKTVLQSSGNFTADRRPNSEPQSDVRPSESHDKVAGKRSQTGPLFSEAIASDGFSPPQTEPRNANSPRPNVAIFSGDFGDPASRSGEKREEIRDENSANAESKRRRRKNYGQLLSKFNVLKVSKSKEKSTANETASGDVENKSTTPYVVLETTVNMLYSEMMAEMRALKPIGNVSPKMMSRFMFSRGKTTVAPSVKNTSLT